MANERMTWIVTWRSWLAIFGLIGMAVLGPARVESAEAETARAPVKLQLQAGDRICLVGNELGERMQHHNYWETLLHQRYPELQLVVRNLCFPGDEPYDRLRSLNFGTPESHLKHARANVVLFFFGYNESFRDEAGLPRFAAELKQLITETRATDYSGQGPPRVALISPIAFEDTGDANLPDGIEHNRRLALYTQTMARVAAELQVPFVDLFHPMKNAFVKRPERLTLDGAHLNDIGYRVLAPILDAGLFELPAVPGAAKTAPGEPEWNEALRAEIMDKNFHWWHRYRAVNGYSIYGKRGAAGLDGAGRYNNTAVMEREREILDQMCAIRDARIWRVARGEAVPAQVDDSTTLPFLEPTTNVGLENDPNRRAGKLGSLDYLSAAEQQKTFQLADGYEIQLVASEEQFPELANPVALNFDSQGRLWVATMPSYPQWQPKTELSDKLLILQDTDGDGDADTCRVFADKLHQPTGFELGRGGVFVAQQPDILFLQDTDGDDRADVRIRKLVGFDSADSHHGISAFEWGPDGALYFQEGTFKQSQVETIHGPVRLSDAGVWRYDPRTEELEVHVSLTFANPWGHVFDRWGQNFVADASPGFNYWATPISGYVGYPDKHPGGCRDPALDFGGSKSNKSYPTFITKRVRPSSGCEIVSSAHFPAEAQGNFLLNNVISERTVLQHRVREERSGFAGEEITPLVSSTDGNFRPVDLQFGPDGALYIVDWHNALIGHLQHNLRDPSRDHSHGRIWRVTYRGRPLVQPPQIAGASEAELVVLLDVTEDRTRYRVRRELAGRDTARVVAALQDRFVTLQAAAPQAAASPAAREAHEHRLLETLWMFQTHHVVHEALLKRLLDSPDHRARAAGTRVVSAWRNQLREPLDWLRPMLRDAHPRVRLEAVRACSFLEPESALEAVLEVLNDEMDTYLDYTLDETVRVLEDAYRAQRVGPSSGAADLPSAGLTAREAAMRRQMPSAALAKTQGQAPPAVHDHAAHDHTAHDHAAAGKAASANADPLSKVRPLVFLDKSPRLVQYQLARLPDPQLLLVERSPQDVRSRLVYEAILTRPGASRQDLEEAAHALSLLNGTTVIHEWFAAIGRIAASDAKGQNVVQQLSNLLLQQPASALSKHLAAFRQGIMHEQATVRAVALAALMVQGAAEESWQFALRSAQARQDFLTAVMLVPDATLRETHRQHVLDCLSERQPLAVRRKAIEALAKLPAESPANFRLVAPLLRVNELRPVAVQTLLQVPKEARSAEIAQPVVEQLVKLAEQTPVARRTTPEFLDAMQLTDELLATLPTATARAYRTRLREVVVRVVRIQTVHEEMRYDTPYFAVEAGRPVQLVLRNVDLMPHNLVITRPGMLRTVAQQAAELPPTVDSQGRQYVPQTPEVLQATRMVAPREQDLLTFTAPTEPGTYPYVCTFPNHWMRMYGVMVVVEDLDAWLANPSVPADPLGITRPFVKSWTVDDFTGLTDNLPSRSSERGAKLFQEATCLQCHKVGEQGGAVGPELAKVFQRHQQDAQAVLRELLDPSHKVAPEYAVTNILTTDGRVISGIVKAQGPESITVISNPENPRPEVISRDDIEEMVKSSTSLMPKGLLDRFTQDEVLELLAYLRAAAEPQ